MKRLSIELSPRSHCSSSMGVDAGAPVYCSVWFILSSVDFGLRSNRG